MGTGHAGGRWRLGRIPAIWVLLGGGLACSGSQTAVVLPPLEMVVAAGDQQYGTVGQQLQAPLQVVARVLTTRLPRVDVPIVWSVESGDAEIVGVERMFTDSVGSAKTTVRLGTTVGEVTVRAQADVDNGASALFQLHVVDRPEVDAIVPASAAPGASVVLSGRNFSPEPDANVVLFSGFRGRVTEATTSSLTVTVPPCLMPMQTEVTAQLGGVASVSRSLSVAGGQPPTEMAVGEVRDLTDPDGFDCVAVSGSSDARYLVIAQSTSSVGAASHPVEVIGSAWSPTGPHEVNPMARLRVESESVTGLGAIPDRQTLWDEELRREERRMTRGRPTGSLGASALEGPARIPSVGERRTFQIFEAPGLFSEVSAVAQFVGERAAFFVDEAAPTGGYTTADLAEFSARFDDFIGPTVDETFGNASDLDGNERIVILLSPEVNALTPRGSLGFVAGFFFGLDLLPEQEGSNAAEIFYSLVPDPNGVHSDPRPRDQLLELIPAILAHEYQHMVNFNERVLKAGAEANEAVWLSEGLAQYAEELVARAYEDAGDTEGAVLFRRGTQDRSRRYLSGPDTVSLIVSVGQGSLAERGGGFLFTLYLADRFGVELPGELVSTTRTGVENVVGETGAEWSDLLSDWWSAVWLDDPSDPPPSPELAYGDVDLRAFVGTPYPLEAMDLGQQTFWLTRSMRSSSVAYYTVAPPADGSTILRVAGYAGGASLPVAGTRLRIIRIE